MMKQLLTLILTFLFFYFGFSQDQQTTINGKITFIDIPINNVHVHNLTTNYGETTNKKGEFRILVKKNDTLKISHLAYQTKKIIITDIHINQGNLTIELKSMTNYLNTVTIKNHNLSGSLFTDAKSHTNDTITKKHDLIKEMMALAKMPSNKIIRNTEKPFLNDVNPIQMTGGGSVGITIKDKENILRRQLRAKKSFPDKLISEFGESYFINELKIPKDKIHHFITYCEYRDINKLYKKNEIMKIIDILTKESIDYLNIKS